MSWDIYGEPLRRGHCEVHPHVHEEYPCSVCIADKRSSEHGDCRGVEHELYLAREHIEHLKQERDALAAPAVQGEPVAWMTTARVLGEGITTDKRHGEKWMKSHPSKTTPLYAAPQPSPDASELVEALESIMGYIPLDVVQCRGDKCRELWCASCFGDEEAESYLVTAERHLKHAKSALAAHRKQGGAGK